MAALAIFVYYLGSVAKARRDTPRLVSSILESDRMKIDLGDLAPERIDMLLKVEDPKFYRHGGVDFRTPGAGITTITQGLVKRMYFKQYKPGIKKLKQTLIAVFALDPMVSKDDQLRLFLNLVYLGEWKGRKIIGFPAASQAYFGEPVRELNEDEYLSLVAMIIAPATYHVKKQPEANAERVRRIRLLLSGEYQPTGLMDFHYGPKPD